MYTRMNNMNGLHPESYLGWISFSQIINDYWPVKSRWQRKRVVTPALMLEKKKRICKKSIKMRNFFYSIQLL